MSTVHRIHHRRRVARVRQPEAVPRLVERHAEHVIAGRIAGAPVERVVEMNVAADRLRRGGRRIERVGEHVGDERKPIAVVRRAPEHRQRPGLVRACRPPSHVHVPRPLGQRARDLSDLQGRAEVFGAGGEEIGQIDRARCPAIPPVADRGVVGDDPLRADDPFAHERGACRTSDVAGYTQATASSAARRSIATRSVAIERHVRPAGARRARPQRPRRSSARPPRRA